MILKFDYLLFFITIISIKRTKSTLEEERLIKNLFKGYNKLIRPVKNSSDSVIIKMDLVLLQLINVYEKEQIMKTNVWINLKWRDFQLDWSSQDYKVGSIRVPSDKVWTPDIVLFNNADGNYEASYKSNIVLYADTPPDETNILWIPPAIYKSSCTIDVKYFPFDEQKCEMRFGSWTFDAQQVRLQREKPKANLEDYLTSGTWDVIDAPGEEAEFTVDNTKRMELVYFFKIRRKTLFYTVNLIIPTVLISFLSIFVFYLPTDEGEKMTLCISILLALVVFLLLVSKILPPTSMVIPLISKYLIFTLIMNIVTILNTVIIINWNYRTPRTHNMPRWVRIVLIDFLPKVLFMKRPKQDDDEDETKDREIEVNDSSINKGENSKSNENSPTHDSNNNNLSNNNLHKINSETNIDFDTNSRNSSFLSRYNNNNLDGCSKVVSTNENTNLSITNLNSNHNSQRPKQQQHRYLDKLTLNITPTSTKKTHFNLNNQQLHYQFSKKNSSNDDDKYDEKSSFKRNRFATLSASDSTDSNLNLHNPKVYFSNQHSSTRNNPLKSPLTYATNSKIKNNIMCRNSNRRQQYFQNQSHSLDRQITIDDTATSDEEKPIEFSREILEAADKISYITNHIKSENDYQEVRDDWKYVALVIDRLQLYIFFSVTLFGTAYILFNAPHIFQFIDQQEILQKLIKENKFPESK